MSHSTLVAVQLLNVVLSVLNMELFAQPSARWFWFAFALVQIALTVSAAAP